MALHSIALLLALATFGIGLGFTYFGYGFVTRLTSLAGGLAGALFGSVAAGALAAPMHGVGSLGPVVFALAGALVGGLLGSWLARSTQRIGIAVLVALASMAAAYSSASAWWPSSLPAEAAGSGLATPLVVSVVAAVVVGALTWKFYRPLLGVATPPVGATVLQFAARHWSASLPVLSPETWTALGASLLVWGVIVASGIVVQYRRYQAMRARAVRVKRGVRRLNYRH